MTSISGVLALRDGAVLGQGTCQGCCEFLVKGTCFFRVIEKIIL